MMECLNVEKNKVKFAQEKRLTRNQRLERKYGNLVSRFAVGSESIAMDKENNRYVLKIGGQSLTDHLTLMEMDELLYHLIRFTDIIADNRLKVK